MKSYDLGCTYGGGANSLSALMEAGLSFISQFAIRWRQSKTKTTFYDLKRFKDYFLWYRIVDF